MQVDLAKESSPTGTNRGAAESSAGGLDTPILGDAIAYAVFVETTEGRESRRLFLSLHSALKAIERAEARGHTATMTLCALVPVGGDAA